MTTPRTILAAFGLAPWSVACPKWQPIESAQVGRTILVWADYMDEPELGLVYSDGRLMEVGRGEWGSEIHGATHWMPLPDRPSAEQAA